MLHPNEVQMLKGLDVARVCHNLSISEQSYYRWRKEYGGLKLDQAKHLKELERENIRLKKIVEDLSIDNSIFKEVSEGNF